MKTSANKCRTRLYFYVVKKLVLFFLRNTKLHEICAYLNLLPAPEGDESVYEKQLLLEILVSFIKPKQSESIWSAVLQVFVNDYTHV